MTMTRGAGESSDAALDKETPDGETDAQDSLAALVRLWNTPTQTWRPDGGATDGGWRDGRPRMGTDTPIRPAH